MKRLLFWSLRLLGIVFAVFTGFLPWMCSILAAGFGFSILQQPKLHRSMRKHPGQALGPSGIAEEESSKAAGASAPAPRTQTAILCMGDKEVLL